LYTEQHLVDHGRSRCCKEMRRRESLSRVPGGMVRSDGQWHELVQRPTFPLQEQEAGQAPADSFSHRAGLRLVRLLRSTTPPELANEQKNPYHWYRGIFYPRSQSVWGDDGSISVTIYSRVLLQRPLIPVYNPRHRSGSRPQILDSNTWRCPARWTANWILVNTYTLREIQSCMVAVASVCVEIRWRTVVFSFRSIIFYSNRNHWRCFFVYISFSFILQHTLKE